LYLSYCCCSRFLCFSHLPRSTRVLQPGCAHVRLGACMVLQNTHIPLMCDLAYLAQLVHCGRCDRISAHVLMAIVYNVGRETLLIPAHTLYFCASAHDRTSPGWCIAQPRLISSSMIVLMLTFCSNFGFGDPFQNEGFSNTGG
jgi:hypothetical protein